MRYLLYSIIILFTACIGDDSLVLPSYTGTNNEVLIVIDDHLWEGDSGDSLRASLTTEVPGISWAEPLFDVVQIRPAAFSRIFKTHRNLIIIQKGNTSKVYFNTKPYAQNQWLCVVEYNSIDDLRKLLGQYAPIMAYSIDEKEHLRYTSKQVNKRPIKILSERFNLSVSLPSEYKLALDTNHFNWFEYNPKDKEIIRGIFVYEFPLSSSFNSTTVLAARDSVLKQFVVGSVEGSYMTTEHRYQPYINTYSQDRFKGLSVKGLWKMQNAFMGGAFVAHYLQDTLNDRGLAIEGFLFSPGEDKRNNLQELEWLISGFKIQSLY